MEDGCWGLSPASCGVAHAPRLVWYEASAQASYAIHEAELDAGGAVVGHALAPLSPQFASVAELRAYLEWLLLTGLDCMAQGDDGYMVGRDGIRSWLDALDQPIIRLAEPPGAG
ncbi:hypothetical protein F8S13_06205 [Chloroflexia bacterium SDU3-3]|nr:hypothetical protein F8S13_06205 [Chloroflexia bacterium SDU3-3]